LENLATRTYHANLEEDDTDVYALSGGDSLSDQSTEEDHNDERLAGDWSIEDGEIARTVAATMDNFSRANAL
jgi:hypothetical protein